ncbi:hypothetical protein WX98_03395 [Pseudomonas syringae pv. persicae]|nr:hypothetical protein WX98_03395 [Pseudomonas syringae pv. persicae]
MVESVLSRQLDDLEPTLTRHGCRIKDLVERFCAGGRQVTAVPTATDPVRSAASAPIMWRKTGLLIPPDPSTSQSMRWSSTARFCGATISNGLFQASHVAVAEGWRDTHWFRAFKVEGGRSTSAAIEGIRSIPDLLAHLFVMSTVDRISKGLIPRDEISA